MSVFAFIFKEVKIIFYCKLKTFLGLSLETLFYFIPQILPNSCFLSLKIGCIFNDKVVPNPVEG